MDTNDRPRALVPTEQASISFYGRELVAVRLEDGRIAAVVRWLCEGMGLDTQAQVRRILRKTALKDELVTVQVQTEGAGADGRRAASNGGPHPARPAGLALHD